MLLNETRFLRKFSSECASVFGIMSTDDFPAVPQSSSSIDQGRVAAQRPGHLYSYVGIGGQARVVLGNAELTQGLFQPEAV